MKLEVCELQNTKDKLIAKIEEIKHIMTPYLKGVDIGMRIPRKMNSLINNAIAEMLKKFVLENCPEDESCYYIKNVNKHANICFVHKYTKDGKMFQNVVLSEMPLGVKIGDVVVKKDGVYVVECEMTKAVSDVRNQMIDEFKNSEKLFKEEGKTYFVCDKSDDNMHPKMNLRIVDSEGDEKEFWGIDIPEELYKQIKYGSKVKFNDGKYIFVE